MKRADKIRIADQATVSGSINKSSIPGEMGHELSENAPQGPERRGTQVLRLRLAGEFQCLTAEGSAIKLPLSKEQGLLAILALSPKFSCPRGKLVNLLWSTREDEQARASLRQSLYSLKSALGEAADVLRVDRKRVALNPSRVSVDVDELKALAAVDAVESLERCVALYAGELLDGLTVRDPAWEEWLTLERENVRSVVVTALRKLIDFHAAERSPEKLIAAGRRLVDIDPFQEEGHRALMLGYAESNQRALALKQYAHCQALLRRELGAEPDRATQSLAAAVKQGVAAGADARRAEPSADAPGSGITPVDRPTAELSSVLERFPRTGPESGMPSILVWPFFSLSGDASQDFLACGFTDDIIIALTAFRELFVFAYKTSMAIDADAEVPLGVAERLGARYVVEGAVNKSQSQLRVSVRLVDARDGRNLWAYRFDRDARDLLAVQDEIVDAVANSLVERIEGAQRRRALEKLPERLLAYDFVLRGRVLLNRYTREGELEARRSFERALELDPASAAAHAGLAVSHIHEYEAPWCEDPERTLSLVFELARKSLELDDLNVMALYALAGAYYYSGEFELANLEIEKAVAINPHDYHNVCSKAWFMTFSGHRQEGLACGIDAMRTNPYAADGCLETIGIGQYLSGHYEQALLAYGATKADSLFKLSGVAACYAQLDRASEATRAARDFMSAADQTASSAVESNSGYWRSYWDRMYRFKDPSDREHFLDGLKKAGIPI